MVRGMIPPLSGQKPKCKRYRCIDRSAPRGVTCSGLVHLATERPSPRQPSGWRGFLMRVDFNSGSHGARAVCDLIEPGCWFTSPRWGEVDLRSESGEGLCSDERL